VRGQEVELSLFDLIAKSIEKTEPGWELNRKAIMPNQVIIRWVSHGRRALVSVALFPSEAEAEAALKSRARLLADMPEKKVTKSEVKGFGAEGYLLKEEGAAGANILFRKGIYMVDVFGPSEELARSFARHVSDVIPTSNKGMNATAHQQGFHPQSLGAARYPQRYAAPLEQRQ